jgi:hypothetical protein
LGRIDEMVSLSLAKVLGVLKRSKRSEPKSYSPLLVASNSRHRLTDVNRYRLATSSESLFVLDIVFVAYKGLVGRAHAFEKVGTQKLLTTRSCIEFETSDDFKRAPIVCSSWVQSKGRLTRCLCCLKGLGCAQSFEKVGA